jgi:hypothetical protein
VIDQGGYRLKAISGGLSSIGALICAVGLASAQVADFQIVWINVGEAASAAEGARAGRQLFMAPDLVEFSLKKVTVANVDVEPSEVALKIGERFCLTSLDIHATSEDRAGVLDAPLSVSVRQDQRERLAIRRDKNNICFTPTASGEYPVRFNSLLPARDGTTRGAQIFLRVAAGNNAETTAESTNA